MYSSDLAEKSKSNCSPNPLSAAVRKLAKSTPRLNDLPSPVVPSDKPMMSARGKQVCYPLYWSYFDDSLNIIILHNSLLCMCFIFNQYETISCF